MNYDQPIEARIMVINNDTQAGMSGTSIESPEGQRPASFAIHWKYPGGIVNKDWTIDSNGVLDKDKVDAIMNQAELSTEEKKYRINELVYQYGSYVLHGGFDSFRNKYGDDSVVPGGCITIY